LHVQEADQAADVDGWVEDGEEVLSFRRGFLTPREFVAVVSALAGSDSAQVLQRLA
jgi:hypothetical protein